MKYLKLKSLTWWSAVLLAALPLLNQIGVPESITDIAKNILMGSGLVGLRAAVKS